MRGPLVRAITYQAQTFIQFAQGEDEAEVEFMVKDDHMLNIGT